MCTLQNRLVVSFTESLKDLEPHGVDNLPRLQLEIVNSFVLRPGLVGGSGKVEIVGLSQDQRWFLIVNILIFMFVRLVQGIPLTRHPRLRLLGECYISRNRGDTIRLDVEL